MKREIMATRAPVPPFTRDTCGGSMTGDVAAMCYWITYEWLDKDGKGAVRTLRITHTWLKDGKDWRIIGGMSMPEPGTPQR